MALEQQVSILAILKDGISTPLNGARKVWKGFTTDVDNLTNKLAPLTGRVAGFVASLVGLNAAREAIAAAEKQVNAETKLLNALRGNREELERIKALAGDLQNRTIIGDEQFIESAALLKSMGVAATDLDDALLAAANTSTALGVSLETAAKGIGLFAAGRAGELGEKIPELAQLAAQGRLAGEGVAFLNEKFAGAAESIAKTPFGKAKQQLNELGDEAEKQGNVFIRLKNAALKGLIDGFRDLTNTITSGRSAQVVDFFVRLLENSGKLLPIIVGIAGAIAGIKIVAFVAPIVLIAAKVALIGGLIGVGVAALLDAFGLLEPLKNFVIEIFERVRSGGVDTESFLDRVVTRIKQFATLANAFILNPIVQVVRAIARVFAGVAQTILGEFQLIGGSIARAIGQPFETVVKFIARQFDKLTGSVADVLEDAASFAGPFEDELRGAAEGLRTSFEKNLEGVNIGEALTKSGADNVRKGLENITQAFPDAAKAVREGLIEADKEAEAAEVALAERRVKRIEERATAEMKANDEIARNERQALETRIREQASFEERLASIRESTNLEVQERIRARAVEDLGRQFEAERLTLEDFIKERRKIEIAPLEEQLAMRRKIIQAIEDQITAIREEKGPNADINDQLKLLVEARLKEQETVQTLIDLERVLARLREDESRKQLERTRQRQDDLLGRAESFRSGLDQRLAEIEQQRQGGFLFSSEATEARSRAIALFRTDIEGLRKELEVLAEKNPQLSASFDELRVKIEQIGAVSQQTTQTIADFGRGFEAGATAQIQRYADLRDAGAAFGGTVVDSVAGLTDAFFEADFSFTKFAANFLKQIAQMILRLILFQAIARALGIATGGGGIGAVQAKNQGGPILAFSGGGNVPGPNVNRDVVAARLTPGEYVLKRDAVEHYGLGIMDALNRMLVPRDLFRGIGRVSRSINLSGLFREGGSVTGGRGGGDVLPVLVSDEQSFARQMAAGGRDALLRDMRQNPDVYRGALGASAF